MSSAVCLHFLLFFYIWIRLRCKRRIVVVRNPWKLFHNCVIVFTFYFPKVSKTSWILEFIFYSLKLQTVPLDHRIKIRLSNPKSGCINTGGVPIFPEKRIRTIRLLLHRFLAGKSNRKGFNFACHALWLFFNWEETWKNWKKVLNVIMALGKIV